MERSPILEYKVEIKDVERWPDARLICVNINFDVRSVELDDEEIKARMEETAHTIWAALGTAFGDPDAHTVTLRLRELNGLLAAFHLKYDSL